MTTTHKEPDYIKIWGILFVLTVVEICISKMRVPLGMHLMVLALLITAFWKATLVAMYYMHLKFEGYLLRFVSICPLFLVAILIFALVPDVAMLARTGSDKGHQVGTAHPKDVAASPAH